MDGLTASHLEYHEAISKPITLANPREAAKWTPAVVGCCKICVVGALQTDCGKAGLGVIIRDWDIGRVMAATAIPLRRSC